MADAGSLDRRLAPLRGHPLRATAVAAGRVLVPAGRDAARWPGPAGGPGGVMVGEAAVSEVEAAPSRLRAHRGGLRGPGGPKRGSRP